MKTLVVADSAYGNTWEIAQAIGGALENARVLRAADAGPADLDGVDLLIVGSPTQGGRPLPTVQEFLKRLPDGALNGVNVAAFDTRFDVRALGFLLRMLLKAIGYAAGKIGSALEGRGGKLIAPPEGFIVQEKEGPLRPGERERAAEWARSLQGALVS